ncbi:MAG: transposase [Thermales bacterium]|nr:transposase [Thermales bacterium]
MTGNKRFILTDIIGRVWSAFLSKANEAEKTAFLNHMCKFATMKARPKVYTVIIADKGFESRKLERELSKLGFKLYSMKRDKRLNKTTNLDVQQESIQSYLNKQISKFRWIVEQVHCHLNKARRLLLNFERTTKSHIAFVHLQLIRLIVRRISRRR